MVAKSRTVQNTSGEHADLYADLQKSYAPSFICKNEGDYFIGVFTGEMNLVTTNPEYGPVLVLEFEFQEGVGTNPDGTPHGFIRGDAVSYWFMGQVQDRAIRKFKPTAGEIVGVKNNGKRRNRAGTFTYNDMKVLMPNRDNTADGVKKLNSWDDLPADPAAPLTDPTSELWQTEPQA